MDHQNKPGLERDDEPVMKPSDLIRYRRENGQLPKFPVPKTVIFVPQKSLMGYILKKYSVKRLRGFIGEFHLMKKIASGIGISSGFGIGAPVVAGLTDEFAALGTEQFILIGLAGGLQSRLFAGSLVISTEIIRGEGVSKHYLAASKTVPCSERLVNKVSSVLDEKNEVYEKGITWSTDAPFRELRSQVRDRERENILAVDMEAAGMLSVARSLELHGVSLFSIADNLSAGQWRMAANLRPAQGGLAVLFDAVIEALKD